MSDAGALKVVGKSGQISLGKQYAGRMLRVEHQSDGTILLRAVAVVPESQLWTVIEPHRSRISRGLEWAAKTAPRETDLADLVAEAKKVRRKRDRR